MCVDDAGRKENKKRGVEGLGLCLGAWLGLWRDGCKGGGFGCVSLYMAVCINNGLENVVGGCFCFLFLALLSHTHTLLLFNHDAFSPFALCTHLHKQSTNPPLHIHIYIHPTGFIAPRDLPSFLPSGVCLHTK